MVYILQDNQLIECYRDALKLELDSEFIELLTSELNRRGLNIQHLGHC